MAPFLPIRAANRSQGIRIGKKHITTDATTYIDLGDFKAYPPVLKELQSHLAIGAVIVVGPLSSKPEPEPSGGKLSLTTELEEETSASESISFAAVTIELKHKAVIAIYGGFEAKASAPENHVKSSLRLNGEPLETGGNTLSETYTPFEVTTSGVQSAEPPRVLPVTFRLLPGTWTFDLHLQNEAVSTMFVKAGAFIEIREQ